MRRRHLQRMHPVEEDPGKMLLSVVIHKSPSGDYEIFEECLESLLGTFYKPSCQMVLLGDFNLNSLSVSNQENFNNLMMHFNLRNMLKTPTRICGTTSTMLDLIYTNLENCKESTTNNNPYSDHETVLFSSGIFNQTPKRTKTLSRNFNGENINLCISEIQSENWNLIYNNNNYTFPQKGSNFYQTFLQHFQNCSPLKYHYLQEHVKP
nr:unnamed protein product [Callosobruchus analis]